VLSFASLAVLVNDVLDTFRSAANLAERQLCIAVNAYYRPETVIDNIRPSVCFRLGAAGLPRKQMMAST
jgi:hypothetical protein